jgi:hypothetical protein
MKAYWAKRRARRGSAADSRLLICAGYSCRLAVLADLHIFVTVIRMGFPPVTLWSDGVRQCVLRRDDTDGRFELLLHEQGRVVRLETCRSEHDARGRAHEWLVAVQAARQ